MLHLSPRAQAIVVLALVATLGGLLGIMGDRLLAQARDTAPSAPPARIGPPGGGPPRGGAGPGGRIGVGQQQLLASLDLSPAQLAAIDSIVEQQRLRVEQVTQEIRPRLTQIAQETRASIEAVLTPEQRAEMRQLRQERVRQLRGGSQRGARPGR